MQFGTVLALAISGVLTDKINWESIFYVFGALGIVWFVFWVLFVFDTPETHPRISKVVPHLEFILTLHNTSWTLYVGRKKLHYKGNGIQR